MSEPNDLSNFVCTRCGECCRIPGQIHLTEVDISRLAAFLGFSEHDFIQRHIDLAQDRKNLVIKGNPDLPCPYLKDNQCSVYAARPEQCRNYPFRWRNPDWRKICKLEIARRLD
ncbi:MAG TPA: YkgJ family cysteine cluster protein [Candidatus Paceibacterota bacterium]|nr:YkgJ family cysteine cluster protein [Verrucomicrobiota bacterium]HRY51854.1 YkgJ family cysteine cluster protein [Candidatus Paceibacterota bacterium]